MPTVLIADDDPDILNIVTPALERRGVKVLTAGNGIDACRVAADHRPDVVVLDIEMPEMDGLEACQRIRQRSLVPIIFLTVRNEEADIVLGLGVGADNYVTKPFHLPELVAKIEAILRREIRYREQAKGQQALRRDGLEVDFQAFEATKDGRPLELTATEFRILQYLHEHVGLVVNRDQLLEHIWGDAADPVFTRTIDVHIGRLRKKLEHDPHSPRLILTVSGIGYKLAR